MSRSEQVSVYASSAEKALLEQLAKQEGRSVSNMLLTLALELAKKKGIKVMEESA